MKRSPRATVIAEARLELTKHCAELAQKHNLTYGEMFDLLGERVQRLAQELVTEENRPAEART